MESAGNNALVESYFVQYLLVAFYSEAESVLKDIIRRRLSVVNDDKVANFIFETSEGMFRRVKKAEINDILKKFACGEGDVISERGGEFNFQPYFDAIANRHHVSHGEGVQMTLSEFEKAIPCAERIFEIVEIALSE